MHGHDRKNDYMKTLLHLLGGRRRGYRKSLRLPSSHICTCTGWVCYLHPKALGNILRNRNIKRRMKKVEQSTLLKNKHCKFLQRRNSQTQSYTWLVPHYCKVDGSCFPCNSPLASQCSSARGILRFFPTRPK